MAPASSKLQSAALFVLSNPRYAVYALLAARGIQMLRARQKKASALARTSSAIVSEESLANIVAAPDEKPKRKRVAVDSVFFKRLWALLKICIPSLAAPEFSMLVLHTGFLVLRTWLSVVVANLDGRLVKNLVTGDGKGFIRGLGIWFALAVPATFTNSMIKYLQSKLSLCFRTRLTRHLHREYLEAKTYYKVINLDSRLENADQLITTDVARFSDALAELYGNLGKPILDMYLFARQLEQGIGERAMGGMWWSYYVTAFLLRLITPNFGRLRAEEAKLEGEFRFAHSRIITNAEEIAFYGGEQIERAIVDERYTNLARHTNRTYRVRIWFHMFEDMLIKYLWSTIGMIAQAVPVFFPSTIAIMATSGALAMEGNAAVRTEKYITNKRLMISLADAGGRIMYSYKDLAELAGYTARVAETFDVFRDMRREHYEKIMVSPEFSMQDIRGTVRFVEGELTLNGVPIVSPNGDLLAKDMSFSIKPGQHLMITGPNGCGKSALVRIISELWPIFRGSMERPAERDIFFVPQRPYLCIGTLRDQVIYPDTVEDMKKKGLKDEDLMKFLEATNLAYIPAREGGWDTVKEWKDVFSGGEKQRIGMARVFYHMPKFAVLDECTSAVSVDVEGLMYAHAKDVGISLITVSHRPSLFKYHNFLLKLDGNGGWTFEELDSQKELSSIHDEIASLEKQLGDMPKLEAQLREVNARLSLRNTHTVDESIIQ